MNSFIKYSLLLCFVIIGMPQLMAQCTLSASSSGGNSSYTQVYVLVDASNNIVAQNTTGTFIAVATGTYTIHALNYNPSDAPSPLPSALIGSPVSNVGSVTAGCFNSDFLTDFVTRTCNAGSCVQSNTVCETDPVIATSSGGNSSYTQMYVLTDDATGLIVATNTTGNFTGLVTASNSYKVYALNYNPSDVPAPLPTVGQTVSDVGTTTTGCFNSDFTTDYVCFNITSCSGSCVQSNTVCQGTDISATSSGGNSSYTQVYVLADDSGNFIDQNNTGTFSTNTLTIGTTYNVHALNYNPSDAPSPLPSAMNAGDALSTISGGCFNSDFLTDYVCYTVTDCGSCVQSNTVCQNTDIMATSSGGNSSYTQVYVLADDSGNFIDQNNTGTFNTNTLTIGTTYHVHALNYNPSDAPSPLPSAMNAGDALSTISGGCFNSDFLTDYVCYTVTDCAPTCAQSRNVCENEDIIATASGFNAAYTQVYVLADDSGNFVAQNTTGTFSSTGLTLGNTYHVHALNYDPANPPSPLPSAMNVGDALSTISGGCFNSDFLTDYLCYTIGCPCDMKLVQYAPNQATAGGAGVQYTVASAYCDDISGWRYYYDPANPNDLLFAINHKPAGGNTNDFTARVTIGVNDYATTTGYDEPISGQDLVNYEANFGMGRYWDVDVLSGSLNGPVNIRFYYQPDEYNVADAAAAAWETAYEPAAIAAGYSGLQQLAPMWFKTNDASAYVPVSDLEPTTVNVTNIQTLTPDFVGTNAEVVTNSRNYVQFNGQISSFSGGTVAFRVTPIPLVLDNMLLSFTGTKEHDHNLLHWSLDTEDEIDYYILERSKDLVEIEDLAQFTSQNVLNYQYADENPYQESYYRLKIYQKDGSYEYSQWVALARSSDYASTVQVYPNPTHDECTVNLTANNSYDLDLILTDVLGREISRQTVSTQSGINKYTIDLSDLTNAVYFLTIDNGVTTIVKKITKI